MLEIINLNKTYKQDLILKNINLLVNKGDFISIQGHSGSGKSTFLNILGLLDYDYEGDIIFNGSNFKQLTKNEIDVFRNRKIGFIFQFFNLLEDFTVLQNVLIPSLVTSFKNLNIKEKKAKEILEICGILDKQEKKISNLSGGEKQRVAIARALINDPDIILADEPTGNLDFETGQAIHNLFKDINKNFNQTLILVTHNSELASIANRKLILNKKNKSFENI